jgi:hypothetical protein
MKTILFLFALVLLIIVAPLFAQKPVVQDSIPQLKEWWHADNMQYGKYGMTWLDNFYHGKGALVVWTPNGVQTWQMRFAGDIENVFTWQKGSANIKAGDFNGDGITDYVDENGNIYEGIQNGQPPKAETQTPVPSFQATIIVDINGDGYDDMMTAGSVVLGKAEISDMKHEKLTFPEIDSNNNGIVGVYSIAPKELRILCRQRYWVNLPNFPFHRDYKNGLRLVRIWWNGAGFSSEKLDEFNVNTDDSTGIYWNGKILSQSKKKYYYVGATLISGKYDRTNVTVYDLSNDKIETKNSMRIDRIADIRTFQHSIDNDTIADWCIAFFQENGYGNIRFYSGVVDSSIVPIGEYTTCQSPIGVSLPLSGGNNTRKGIALSGDNGSCFRAVKIPNTTNVENEPLTSTSSFLIESITPQPVNSKQTIQVRLSAPLMSNYEISLFSYTGNKLFQMNTGQMVEGVKTISIPLAEYNLLKGVYWLTLTVGKQQIHSKLIIN